jgi:uncharacterized protein (TIGR01777 family)
MGLFDTLYHHEFTERLAWRPSQQRELRLHAARNLLYAGLFLTLGWAEVGGWLAILVMAALAAEIVITLMDFVEEDITRRLPTSERILHTLLAVNYGAILAVLLPVLIVWTAKPTALAPTSYGYWSVLASMAAFGTVVFAVRDFSAARRSQRLQRVPVPDLVRAMSDRHTVLVTGATGFIGSRLCSALAAAGHEVIALVRDPEKANRFATPFRLVTSLDQLTDDTRIDAIVNLAGEPIANGLWTDAKRLRIIVSRLRVTEDIIRLVERLTMRPAVLVSGSAAGWYGLRGDEFLTESAEASPCFSSDACEHCECAAKRAEALGMRVVLLRTGFVLGIEGGILSRLLAPFEFGLGGAIGSGRQWWSWIERDDLVRLIAHAIATPAVHGPLNATAPKPVRNATFATELARALRRPAFLRLPARFLRLVGGDFADELLLGGQRVLPAKATATGFAFRYPTLPDALAAMLGASDAARAEGVRRQDRSFCQVAAERARGSEQRADLNVALA